MNETNKQGEEVRILKIEDPNTQEYKDYQILLKELKIEQRAKNNLPRVIFTNKEKN
jgi:hypothetical protein